MRLLVHVAGEADLLLKSGDRTAPASHELRAARVATRHAEIAAALTGPGGPHAARDMLTKGAWNDEPFSTPAPSPLFAVLSAMDATPDLNVMVLGTTQESPHPLDTLPVARTLADTLNGLAVNDEAYPARKATAVAVCGMAETSVVRVLTDHLGDATRYRQALVTWGSGATTLVMGALTALSRAGLRWQLVLTSEQGVCDVVDPLQRLDIDPVAGLLVRWRMFAALDAAAREDPPAVQLTDKQRDLVRRAADRHRAGIEARDCASLRAVLADAVVRRDGTASLTVRRYITSRYEELLAIERTTHPRAVDLLRRYEKAEGGPSLGVKLGKISRAAERGDPVVCASVDLPSYTWLYGPEVASLQNIGRGSHTLRPPAPGDSKFIGDYLCQYDIDGSGWRDAELPEPPVTPADTVLAVWLAGGGSKPDVGTVGEQLSRYGLPAKVREYLDVEEIRIRAVIFGVEGENGSSHHAAEDAKQIRAATHESTGGPRGEAWTEPTELTSAEPATIEQAIERRITRDTGALLLIPTGGKQVLLPLLTAMRRLGARYGIPLFVRETAKPTTPGDYTVHLWPALTGGDLPLLNAAKNALRALELDVAWRLLAASAISPEVTENARQLAAAFASRQPVLDTDWPQPDPSPTPDLCGRTSGMIVQRLALVNDALAYATTSADRIRLLVLAADVMEASIAATRPGGGPGHAYRAFKDRLNEIARRRGTPTTGSARILLLLNRARDRAPITHGTLTDPDALVADAANHLARKWGLSPAETAALPYDVPALLSSAITAAAEQGLGQIGRRDNLLALHQQMTGHIGTAIYLRSLQG